MRMMRIRSLTFIMGLEILWAFLLPVCAAQVSVSILDASTGKPTPAAVGLYDARGRIRIPNAALDLSSLGYLYRAGHLIHYADWLSPRVRTEDPYFGSAYFRDKHLRVTDCFFVDGTFQIKLAPGTYRLLVGKGIEYMPIDRHIRVAATGNPSIVVRLSRWVNMAERGWYSGDDHVHAERDGPGGNRIPLIWARAEDVHMVNVLAMGDAKQTYYHQYAFGPAGRVVNGKEVLVPGQEDPRTRYLGHTLFLDTTSLIRNAKQYYSYLPIFERAQKQHALAGFAHVGRRRWSFHVDRGLSLLVPFGVVNFVEIGQMGYIGVNLWYEFLDLGFRLTAMAGTDVPWGGTIGSTRVYAYTGRAFDANRWFKAVREGHTFVTTGPMLDFSVNKQLPGSVLHVHAGSSLKVKARAWGAPPRTKPIRLQIVSFGKVLQQVQAAGTGVNQLNLVTVIRPSHSMWITARCDTNRSQLMDRPGFFSGAIATPVYVVVDGKPIEDTEALGDLVRRRLDSLDAINKWISSSGAQMKRGALGGWESPPEFRASIPQIRSLMLRARRYYLELLKRERKKS